MRKFEFIEHTADAGVRAYGASMAEAFENCALGMMALMLEPESVRPTGQIELVAKGNDSASLLVSWLAEIVFMVDSMQWVFREFKVADLSELQVRGCGLGEHLDPERHLVKLEIKAPTYHMLELKEEAGRWIAQVIFDV